MTPNEQLLYDALVEMVDAYWTGSEDSDDEHAPTVIKQAMHALETVRLAAEHEFFPSLSKEPS